MPEDRFRELVEALQCCEDNGFYPATEHYLEESLLRQSGPKMLDRLNCNSFQDYLWQARMASRIADAGLDPSGIKLYKKVQDRASVKPEWTTSTTSPPPAAAAESLVASAGNFSGSFWGATPVSKPRKEVGWGDINPQDPAQASAPTPSELPVPSTLPPPAPIQALQASDANAPSRPEPPSRSGWEKPKFKAPASQVVAVQTGWGSSDKIVEKIDENAPQSPPPAKSPTIRSPKVNPSSWTLRAASSGIRVGSSPPTSPKSILKRTSAEDGDASEEKKDELKDAAAAAQTSSCAVTPPEREPPPAPTSTAVKSPLEPRGSWTPDQLNDVLFSKAVVEQPTIQNQISDGSTSMASTPQTSPLFTETPKLGFTPSSSPEVRNAVDAIVQRPDTIIAPLRSPGFFYSGVQDAFVAATPSIRNEGTDLPVKDSAPSDEPSGGKDISGGDVQKESKQAERTEESIRTSTPNIDDASLPDPPAMPEEREKEEDLATSLVEPIAEQDSGSPATEEPPKPAGKTRSAIDELLDASDSDTSDGISEANSIASVAGEEMQDLRGATDARSNTATNLLSHFSSSTAFPIGRPLNEAAPTMPAHAVQEAEVTAEVKHLIAASISQEPSLTATDGAVVDLEETAPVVPPISENPTGIDGQVNILETLRPSPVPPIERSASSPAPAAITPAKVLLKLTNGKTSDSYESSDQDSAGYVSSDDAVPKLAKPSVSRAPPAVSQRILDKLKENEPTVKLSDVDLLLLQPAIEDNKPSIGENAPTCTMDAMLSIGHITTPPGYGLFGAIIKQESPDLKAKFKDPRLLLHDETPFTAVITGVQGSGKSHSTSVILENCLLSKSTEESASAISGLVLHFESISSGGAVVPCEAAFLAGSDPMFKQRPIEVTVFVSPNCISRMRHVYSRIPNVKVEPFFLTPEDLDVTSMLSIMQLESGENVPLYMASVLGILMDLSNGFTLERFYQRIDQLRRGLAPMQDAMLQQRIALLRRTVKSGVPSIKSAFQPGKLAVLDLSDPFIDAGQASSIFEIVLGLHMGMPGSKIVALDEAHKYLKGTASAKRLTSAILGIVRQQRHLGARVIVSTQEPTVVPAEILDLASFVMVHRFSSPAWGKHLGSHVGGAMSRVAERRDEYDDRSASPMEWFDKAVSLKTGEALLFSPASLALRRDGKAGALGTGYLHMRTRRRITTDGGRTVLASHKPVVVASEPPRPPTPKQAEMTGW